MRVWLVTAAEPIPSDGVRPMRFMGLARALAGRGHEVTLWTQTFFHHTKRHRFAADTEYAAEGYRVVVLRAFGYRTNISLRRYASHWRFARRLAAEMPGRPAPDVVVTSLPPLDTAAATADYAGRRGIPLVVDVIDPWPDVFVELLPPALQRAGRVVSSPLRRRATRIVRSAHAVTAISRRYAAWAEGLAAPQPVATAVFHPAVQLGTFDPRARDPRDGGPLRVVYAGALGRAYDLDCVIACARLLAAQGAPVEIAIAGEGPERARLERQAAGLSNVRFLGWLDASALATLLAGSDVGLACYRRDATQTVTYKLFEYAGTGLPVVCSLAGEMGALIEEAGAGMLYRAEDPADLARVLRGLDGARDALAGMRARARAFAEERGDAMRVYGAMAGLIEDAARPRWRANA